jgi:hypothetical protein
MTIIIILIVWAVFDSKVSKTIKGVWTSIMCQVWEILGYKGKPSEQSPVCLHMCGLRVKILSLKKIVWHLNILIWYSSHWFNCLTCSMPFQNLFKSFFISHYMFRPTLVIISCLKLLMKTACFRFVVSVFDMWSHPCAMYPTRNKDTKLTAKNHSSLWDTQAHRWDHISNI